MQLKDFFTFDDLIRTAVLGSALLFFVGTFYGVFLHAQYASQVDGVKLDLQNLGDWLDDKASKAYKSEGAEKAKEFKVVALRAKDLAKQVEAPPVSPSAYAYLNYWIASAAFTDLHLTYEQLGLPQKTVYVMNNFSTPVLGRDSWWSHPDFLGVSRLTGEVTQFLKAPPKLHTYFWTFYIFVFVVALFTLLIATKRQYEIPILPYVIYGAGVPVIFFGVFAATQAVALTGIIPLLDPSQISITVSLLAFVIMLVLSAFAGMIVGVLKMRKKTPRTRL